MDAYCAPTTLCAVACEVETAASCDTLDLCAGVQWQHGWRPHTPGPFYIMSSARTVRSVCIGHMLHYMIGAKATRLHGQNSPVVRKVASFLRMAGLMHCSVSPRHCSLNSRCLRGCVGCCGACSALHGKHIRLRSYTGGITVVCRRRRFQSPTVPGTNQPLFHCRSCYVRVKHAPRTDATHTCASRARKWSLAEEAGNGMKRSKI